MTRSNQDRQPRRAVIIGAGFGGLSAAVDLKGPPFQVTLIDQHHYHLFPLLLIRSQPPQLPPAEIARFSQPPRCRRPISLGFRNRLAVALH